jgi:uncharacterized membrane protein
MKTFLRIIVLIALMCAIILNVLIVQNYYMFEDNILAILILGSLIGMTYAWSVFLLFFNKSYFKNYETFDN